MGIPTKEELFVKGKVKSETVPFPELGEGTELVIRGFSISEIHNIQQSSILLDQDGKRVGYDDENDTLMSIVAAVKEPDITAEDAAQIKELSHGIGAKIIYHAKRLSGMTVDSYTELKELLRTNRDVRALYDMCRKYLKRLPSELGDNIPALEFRMMLASAELEEEDELEALERLKHNQSDNLPD